jgi:hypothetical protein
MKTFICSLILVLVWTVQSIAAPAPVDGGRLDITIRFGLPLMCTGWGICDFEATLDTNEGVHGYIEVGDGSGGGGGGSWVLGINKASLKKHKSQFVSQFEGKTSVSFGSTIEVPESVMLALGDPRQLIIQGNSTYPVRELNGYYVVRIPL